MTLSPRRSGSPCGRDRSRSFDTPGAEPSARCTEGKWSARRGSGRGGSGACRGAHAKCAAWARSSVFSFGQLVAQALQHGKGRAGAGLGTVARVLVAIHSAAWAQPTAVISTNGLHRLHESNQLEHIRCQVQFAAPEPARLQLFREEDAVSSQCRRPLGIGRYPIPCCFQHEAKALTNRLTIAGEAAPARQLELGGDAAIEVQIEPHRVATQCEHRGFARAVRSLPRSARSAPLARLEREGLFRGRV